MVMVESEGIIINARVKIESNLRKDKAFDEKSATDILEFGAVLDIMEKGGLVTKTNEGKYFMTKKGQGEQVRGFSLMGPGPHKIVKFSRNK
jgi:hypothetical protein